MALSLKCPSCRSAVTAEEADRGRNVKCGTCWSDVSVPKAETGTAPAIPVAKALPLSGAAPIPKARLAPAAPQPAKAIPLPAKPAVAKAIPIPATLNPSPSQSGETKKPTDDKKEKPRFKSREEDDDEDDKRDRRKKRSREEEDDEDAPKKKGNGVMIAFLCIGGVMLLGLIGGGVALAMGAFGGGDQAAATTTARPNVIEPDNRIPVNPNPGPGGGLVGGGDFNPNPFNPNPNPGPKPGPAPAAIRPDGWKEFKVANFAMECPEAVSQGPTGFEYAGKKIDGKIYLANEPSNEIKISAKELDLPPNTRVTSTAFVAAAFDALETKLKKDPNPRLVNGHPGIEYSWTGDDGFENAILAVGVGNAKAFLFRFQNKAGANGAVAKRDAFLAGVTIFLEVPNNAVNPGFPGRDDPRVAKPITVDWKPIENKEGFKIEVPPGVKVEKHLFELENKGGMLGGKKWTVDDGDVAYWCYYHDLATADDFDLRKIAGKLIHEVFPHEINLDEATKVDGKPGRRWTIKHFHGGLSYGVSVRVGYRVFTFFVTSKLPIYQGQSATLDERQDKFLNSLKITFDPKTHKLYADETDWVAMPKATGFTVGIPRASVEVNGHNVGFGRDAINGKHYKSDLDGVIYEVYLHELPPNKAADDVVKEIRKNEKLVAGPVKTKLGQLDAEGYEMKNFFDVPFFLRSVTVQGKMVYTLKVSKTTDWNVKVGEKEFLDKSNKFFESFKLGEGGVVNGGGGANIPGPGGNSGEFVKIAEGKVKPFWTAAFHPEKKEFLTFGIKDSAAASPTGILRRYSVPDFKLKATYTLPKPVNRVAIDEKGGKLYCAAATDPVDAKASEKESLIATGEVQQYDLRKITDDSYADAEMLKPTNTISTGSSKISGLEVSPDGASVYISTVVFAGVKPKLVLRGGKFLKWDVVSAKFATDISSDFPIWSMDLTADGKRLVGIERSLNPNQPGGNVVILDAVNWKRIKSAPIAGTPPNDVAALGERTLALLTKGDGTGAAKLCVVESDGDSNDIPLEGDATYVRAANGGKSLFVSLGIQGSGLTWYEIDAAKPAKLTKKAFANDLAAQFVLSPDDKLLVTNTGTVIDLEKTGKK